MNPTKIETGPLGLLGGTFDPIHLGHLRLAEEAREALELTEVCFIPAGDPPHRQAPSSSAAHRLAMTRIATADNPAFSVDGDEALSARKSYTVVTLERLRARLGPTRSLVLIVGADAFLGLPTWHRWTDILELAHIGVASRPGVALHGQPQPGTASTELDAHCGDRFTVDPCDLRRAPAGWIVPFDMTPLAISASLIRNRVGVGRSVRYLLSDPVLDYIRLHHLYPGTR